MKKQILLLGAMLFGVSAFAQQPPTNTAPGGVGPSGQNNQQFWSRAGNNSSIGQNNIFGTNAGFNSPIYTVTNGVNRTVLMGTNPAGSISGAFGIGTNLLLPQSKLHVRDFGVGALDANGRLFRTDGSSNVANEWGIWTGTVPFNSLQRFRVSTGIGPQINFAFLGTVQDGALGFVTNNTERVTILGEDPLGFPYERGGFVGFNNTNPQFHLDINTPEPDGNVQYGELLLRARIADDPNAYMGIVNIATNGQIFIPTLFAHQSDNPGTALTTLGSITNNQDVATNLAPVTRFISGRNYDPSTNPPTLALQRNNVIENRRLFTWQNAVDLLMVMEANGFLGIGMNNPGNRVEINSDFYNPTNGQPTNTNLGGPQITALTPNGFAGATGGATGFSGLRFSDLNANSIPRATNPGTGVLAVDENGDVVYVVGGAGGGSLNGAHNGTTISLFDPTKVALGQDLGQGGNPGELLNTREIPMNDFNLLFTDAGSSNGSGNNIGVGTSIPDSKVHVVVNPTVIGAVPTGVKIENFASSLSGFSYGNQIVVSNPTNFYNAGLSVQVPNAQTSAVGIDVNTSGNVISFGVQGWTSNGSIENRGISGVATVNTGFNSVFSNGVVGQASNASNNTGGTFSAVTASGFSSDYNYGVIATSGVNGSGSVQNSFGIFAASYAGSNVSRSGYFVGQMETTAPVLITSDQQFKTNVNVLNGSLKAIQALKPVSYYMDTVNFNQFNFDSNQQFGFIAQQVETAFPNLVYQSVHPATFDSLGNELIPATSYKSLNYNAIIPINTQAIIELNQKVDKATLSDQTIKTNVQDLNGSLNKVLQMRGVSYDWNQSVNPSLNLDSANHIGFIAQEIAQVDPRLTFLADDSLLHVEYDKVVPILAEAIEELNNTVEQKDSIINDLNNRLTNLENCLSALLPTLCQMNQSAIQANTPAAQEAVRQNLQVTLSNRSTIILDQNVPNPFAEQTVINFSIPASVAKAQMHFYDGNGRLIQTLEIAERGLGAVTVFGSDLSSGTYTYTLVADGAVVATKKMMKQ